MFLNKNQTENILFNDLILLRYLFLPIYADLAISYEQKIPINKMNSQINLK